MRVLTISSAFPPHTYGGGEISAYELSCWLAAQGHDVGVLTTATDDEPELHGALVDGLRYWRLHFPRAYAFHEHQRVAKVRKPYWQAQDYADPRNKTIFAKALDAFQPDYVNIHNVIGMGFNALGEIARRDIPTTYFMHDLGLACWGGGMFNPRRADDCTTRCLSCRVVSHARFGAVTRIPRVSFCSPSRANLETAGRYLPLDDYLTASILNVNSYPPPTVERSESPELRFLFVGRLHPSKGAHILLEAAEALAARHRFTVTVIGGGPQEEELRRRWGDAPWCRILGHRMLAEVSDHMARSDVVCVPSVVRENSPGSAIHALRQGVPVIASRKGGVPELVEHGANGLLVEAGDTEAWEAALKTALTDPGQVAAWGRAAAAQAGRFDPDRNGRLMLDLFERTTLLPRRDNPSRITGFDSALAL